MKTVHGKKKLKGRWVIIELILKMEVIGNEEMKYPLYH